MRSPYFLPLFLAICTFHIACREKVETSVQNEQSLSQEKIENPPTAEIPENQPYGNASLNDSTSSSDLGVSIPEELHFPFGQDLQKLTVSSVGEEAGDCASLTSTWQNDGLKLVIDSTNCYMYGYHFEKFMIRHGELKALHRKNLQWDMYYIGKDQNGKDSVAEGVIYSEAYIDLRSGTGESYSRRDTLSSLEDIPAVPFEHIQLENVDALKSKYEETRLPQPIDFSLIKYEDTRAEEPVMNVFLDVPGWNQSHWIGRYVGYTDIARNQYQDLGIPAKAVAAWSTAESNHVYYLKYIEGQDEFWTMVRYRDDHGESFTLERQVWKYDPAVMVTACYRSDTLNFGLKVAFSDTNEIVFLMYENGSARIPLTKYRPAGESYPHSSTDLYAEIIDGHVNGYYTLSRMNRNLYYTPTSNKGYYKFLPVHIEDDASACW